MNYFLNYNKGEVSIETYRLPNASVTGVRDIVEAHSEERNEILTASIDDWIDEELKKIDISGLSSEEADNIVFGEQDFLEQTLGDKLGFWISDYPDLRDAQYALLDGAR